MISRPTRWLCMVLAATGVACGGETEEVAFDEVAVQPTTADTMALPAPQEGGAELTVNTLPTGDAYVADRGGRALYLLEQEPQGQSTCYDACAEEWTPFLAPQGTPTAGAAPVQPELIGTLQRRDGSTQVTYGGHALYYYHEDQRPGQTRGQDVTDQWGEWYLVQPSGEALEQHEAPGSS